MPDVRPDRDVTAALRRRVSDVAGLALRQSPERRADYIAAACADDDLVREQVLALVAEHDASGRRDGAADVRAVVESTVSYERTRLADPGAPTSDRVTPRRTDAATTRTWGDFALLEELGRGGFGVVYRAWDAALRRDVALKLVSTRGLPAGTDATLLREGQLMARVRHPNVVTVFSAQLIGTDVGLAMEYIQGRTLSALLAQQGAMGAHEATVIGVALCSALSAVHRVGLLHRDIKASNVMREHGGRLVLMDFGAGRECDAGDPRSGLVGTPVCMAPEVLLRQQATPASDVYGLGVLLYHLVTNEYPVRGHTIEQLCAAHQCGARRPLGDARPDLPEPFVRVVERALLTDLSQRYSSAAALKRDLMLAMPGAGRDPMRRSTRRGLVGAAEPRRDAAATSWTWVQGIGGVLVALVVLAAMMGFVTTRAFNLMFGRTGGFAEESALTVLGLGARSLVAPLVSIALAIIMINTLFFVGRVVMRITPGGRRVTAVVHDWGLAVAARAHLGDPTVLAHVLCLATCLALGAVVWTFSPLLGALMSNVDTGAASDLGLLATSHVETHVRYRLALDVTLLGAGAGIAFVVRRARQLATRVPGGSLAGMTAAVVIGLVLLALPWRTLWSASFPRVQIGGHTCYLVGQSGNDHLVTCPTLPVSRSRVVRGDDPQMSPAQAVGRPFDDFGRVAGEPR